MDDASLTIKLCEIAGALPGFTWSPTPTTYPADTTAVFYGRIADAPDRAIGIRVYSPADLEHLSRRRVQVWVRGGRGEPDGADRIADAVFARFDSLSREGGILGIRRDSFAAIGADANGREQRSENYIVTLDNKEALQ